MGEKVILLDERSLQGCPFMVAIDAYQDIKVSSASVTSDVNLSSLKLQFFSLSSLFIYPIVRKRSFGFLFQTQKRS